MKMGRLLCLCTFSFTVHPPNSVCPIYTSLAMLYVGYRGRKGFWKLKEKFLQRIQPNLWTVLIANFFFFFRKDFLFQTTK